MKKELICLLVLMMVVSVQAQDWVNNKAALYYYGEHGKIYIEPDYSKGPVIYFVKTPTVKFKSQLFAKMAASSRRSQNLSESSIKIKDLKGLVELEGVGDMISVETPERRAKFMDSYDLSKFGAYDVLPKFRVNGEEIAFSKKVIVSLKEGKNLEDVSSIINNYEGIYLRNTNDAQTMVLEVNKIENQLALIQELHRKGAIKWGQPDFRVKISRFDDPLYPDQFQMNNTGGSLDGSPLLADMDIDAPEAWAVTTGSSAITVSVVDDGLESHPDLPAISAGITPATNGNGTPLSDGAHGVSCAGIISAQHNDIGVRGVAPGVNLLSVNIFTNQETVQDLADAFSWSVQQGADVISNSWGFSGNCSLNLYPALTNAISDAATNGRDGKGCVVVFASGNDFGSCVSYPGNNPDVIAVGAVQPSGVISSYSNQGSRLDVVAPSQEVTAADVRSYGVRTTDRVGSNGYSSGNYTNSFGGTSAACPAVAGVAALVLSVNSDLTSSEVYDIITSTADDMGAAGFDNTYGYGRVNAFDAIQAAGAPVVTCELPAPTNFTSSGVSDTGFSLSWSAVTDADSYTVTVAGSSTTTTSTSFALSSLSPGTAYSCSVVANCTDGGSSPSASITVTTTGTNPDVSDVLVESGFGSGFDGFVDGGTNAAWYSGSSYMDTAPFVYVRDNTSTSTITSPAFDASDYEQIYLEFDLQFFQMEGSDRLDVYFYDGSSWTNLGGVPVSEYGNNVPISVSVAIDDADFTLASDARIRFEGEGSSTTDYSFIDNVTITGNSGGAVVSAPVIQTNQGFSTMSGVSLKANGNDQLEGQINLYPNAVVNELNVEGIQETSPVKLLTVSGQLIRQGVGLNVINMAGLPKGIYLLQVGNGDELEAFKVIKE